jgi:hypothetical protein
MASNNSDVLANWTLSDVHFTKNCDMAAEFLGVIARNADTPDQAWYPYSELINVVRAVDPIPFRNVTRGEIVDWVYGLDENLPSTVFHSIRESCHTELCQHLDWQGNADLAGIGVG